MTTNNKFEELFSKHDLAHELKLARIDKVYSGDLDSTFNFRCNGEIKKDFIQLCKVNQTRTSVVLKTYMLACIRSDKLL